MAKRCNANNARMRKVLKALSKRLPFTHVPRTVPESKQNLQNRILAGLHFLKAPMEAWCVMHCVCIGLYKIGTLIYMGRVWAQCDRSWPR